jgi:hypothetical protein
VTPTDDRQAARDVTATVGTRGGPFDVLAAMASWSDILGPAGYTFVREHPDGSHDWLRPHEEGDPPSSEYSLRCNYQGVPVAVVFSDATGLPVGKDKKLTHGRLFAHLHHDGDEPAATRDLLAAAAGKPAASPAARSLPPYVLQAINEVRNGDTAALFDPGVPPTPLTQLGIPEPFPVEALPTPVAEMVEAVAEFTQTDSGMAGTVALGVLAASAGGRAQIQVRPGWREPVNLYTAIVACPGERKSAVHQVMTRPLVEAEHRLAQAVVSARLEAETTKGIAHRVAEKAKVEAGKASDSDRRMELVAEAVAAAEVAASIEVPVIPHLLADDLTPEACVSLLAEQHGRLALISAEGGIFEVISGRYSNNVPVLDVWLKGHSGDPLRVDRKGREREYIKRPALTLVLMNSAAVLTTLSRNGVFRARGLLARFLYAMPPDRVGDRKVGASGNPCGAGAGLHRRRHRSRADASELGRPCRPGTKPRSPGQGTEVRRERRG